MAKFRKFFMRGGERQATFTEFQKYFFLFSIFCFVNQINCNYPYIPLKVLNKIYNIDYL